VSLLHGSSPSDGCSDVEQPAFAAGFEGATPTWPYNCLDRHLQGPRAEEDGLYDLGRRTLRHAPLHYTELQCQGLQGRQCLLELGLGKSEISGGP